MLDTFHPEIVNPNVGNLVTSLRDIGYTFEIAVADIIDKVPTDVKRSHTTLRKILQLFVNTGLVKSAKYQDRTTYFALVSNESALIHLNKLKQYKKRKLKSQV